MCGAYTNHTIHVYGKTYPVEFIYPFAAGFNLEKAYILGAHSEHLFAFKMKYVVASPSFLVHSYSEYILILVYSIAIRFYNS